MQVEIKSVKQNDHEYEGKVTKRKLIETSEGSYNVSDKNKSYSFIPLGFSGIADIEFSDYKGKKFIKIFKAGKGSTKTPQKPQETQARAINGAFKKDPAGINLERKIQLYKNWTNVFNGCIELCKCGKIDVADIVEKSNEFFNASFETISNLGKEEPKKEVKQDTAEQTEPKPQEQTTETESKNIDIKDVPF